MPMILQLTEGHVTQEYFEGTEMHGPFYTESGVRGLVKEAGYASQMPGIDDGTPIAVLQVINELAEFELVAVPLSKTKIVWDRQLKPNHNTEGRTEL